MARGLLARPPDTPLHVVCNRGYASNAFREHIWPMGARPTIPPRRTDPPVCCDAYILRNRNVVERLWGRLKEWRAVATRYEKTARSFVSVLQLAATLGWIKNQQGSVSSFKPTFRIIQAGHPSDAPPARTSHGGPLSLGRITPVAVQSLPITLRKTPSCVSVRSVRSSEKREKL